MDFQPGGYKLTCTMIKNSMPIAAALVAAIFCPPCASAQYSTPAAKPEDLAAYYTGVIERRTTGIRFQQPGWRSTRPPA